jgi:hypothetical protein
MSFFTLFFMLKVLKINEKALWIRWFFTSFSVNFAKVRKKKRMQ